MIFLFTEPECYDLSSFKKLTQKGHFVHLLQNANQTKFEKLNKDIKPEIIILKLGIEINNKHLNNNKNLKYIFTPTTGTTNINIDDKKIKIFSLKNEKKFLKKITSTAEHAWFLLLDSVRNNQNNFIYKNTQKWSRKDKNISQISDKNLGIIGYGRIGKILAKYGEAFQMNIFINEKNKKIRINKKYNSVSLINLLNLCDYVIIAVNYSGYKIITKDILKKINQRIEVLVNVSRGELIDERSFAKSINDGQIMIYATDVLNNDSSWHGNEFKDNVIYKSVKKKSSLRITPHVGGYSIEAIRKTRSHLFKMISNIIL